MLEPKLKGKSYVIPKQLVWDAWLKVREKGGSAGADGVTIEQFEEDLSGTLFKLWNRMSSGSYFPGPVRAVDIPKKKGSRRLGIPNIVDRVAQTAAAMALEPSVEQVFHDDSYGYRPGRSPLEAVAVCRERGFRKDWVLDVDIRKFFDSVPWDLTLKALARHTDQKWVLLYVERWLKAPMLMPDGSLVPREKGTPQGSPISPLIANLFLHYGFDAWMVREFPAVQFERFADDVVIHCVSESHARELREALARRLVEVGLELHPEKTKIVCVSRSYVELAGERPVAVMTKQPRSWWAVEGETRLSKPHDKVAVLGGEQACGPYDEESCVSVDMVPARAGRSGSRASIRWAKAREGAKTLELQHRGTRRRIGIGTYAQFSTERERSVSAPAFTAPGCQSGALREVAIPITGSTGKWWSAERKSEEAVVAMIGVDNITRRSEGPLARCAIKQRPRLVRAEEPRRSLGPIANAVASGMPSVDCLGESRVRENLMHGLGRGERSRAEDAQPLRSLGGISVARLSPTSHCKDSNRRGTYEHVSFTFCGYAFRPRKAVNKRRGVAFTSFLPAVSPGKLSEMSRRAASWRLHRHTTWTLNGLAKEVNPVIGGWLAYYTAFYPSAVAPLCRRMDRHLVRWARWKYKRLERSGPRARTWLRGVHTREPELFVHWRHCAPTL